MTPPRLLLPALACAVAVACAGCAEGDVGRSVTPDRFESDDAERSGAEPSPSPSATSTPLTAADATSAAADVRLEAGDLQGSTPSDVQDDARAAVVSAWTQHRECVGADARPLVDDLLGGLSRSDGGSTQLVSGVVSVLAEESSVDDDLEVLRGDQAATCAAELAEQAVASLAGQGAQVGEPEVAESVPQVAGAEGFGHRAELVATVGQQELPITVDLVGVARGRAEIAVIVIATGQPLSTEERDGLVRQLADRAQAVP